MAMSASETGEFSPLVQVCIGVRKERSASAPASRTAASKCEASWPTFSYAGNGEALDTNGRRVGAIAKGEIVGRGQRPEHLQQMTGDRHLTHRVGQLTVLDPKPGGAATVVAGHDIGAHADQIGDVQALGDVRDQGLGR